MPDTDTFGSFISENKKLLRDYIETRMEVFRLTAIRSLARSAGYTLWIIISLMLLLLLVIFGGLVTGFWLSAVTGSFTKGFGFTTLIILAVILLITLFRKKLFVNPIIRNFIACAGDEDDQYEPREI